MSEDAQSRTWLIWVALAGVVLLLGPTAHRVWVLGVNERTYADTTTAPLHAATPESTATAVAIQRQVTLAEPELRSGPVVVDFAHFNQLNAEGLQPLASALAKRGLATRIWLSDLDPLALQSIAEIPDQSADLRTHLQDASAMVVVSPYIWWQQAEVDVLEEFVADGGRLLLISDPDIAGDTAVYMNLLSERFGVVFNDDYLYDSTRNDANYTHFFLDNFADEAASLQGSTIAMYGGRSISGDVSAEASSAHTTLSSRRTGESGFTTVAIGGDSGRGTNGRVLALADFDVLAEPQVARFDNQRLVDFTADFLAAGERTQSVADFPNSLGKQVTLLIGTEGALNADTLLLGARLQRRLEETGRTLTLAGDPNTSVVNDETATSAAATPNPGVTLTTTAVASSATTPAPHGASGLVLGEDVFDRLVLSDYDYANTNGSLLSAAGITIVTELITPTLAATPMPLARPPLFAAQSPTATATQTATNTPQPDASPAPQDEGATERPIEAVATARPSPIATATATPTATPTTPPTPVEVRYLVADDGLKLLAAETVIVIQSQGTNDVQSVSVIGADVPGIGAGVDRLLLNDFSDCIIGDEVTYCPVANSDGSSQSAGTSATTTPAPASTPVAGSTATPLGPQHVLLIDDDAKAQAGERSEADTYLKTLTAAGYSPDLWSTAEKGAPDAEKMKAYAWVIWSNAGYVEGKIDVDLLDPLFAYLGGGGRLTISSRRPFFNMSASPASAIRDVLVRNNVPELVAGLPTEPIVLEGEFGNVIPLQEAESGAGFATILVRGPASADAGNPAASAGSDANEPDAVGARLVIIGFSNTWLPATVADRFIRNMADWILSNP